MSWHVSVLGVVQVQYLVAPLLDLEMPLVPVLSAMETRGVVIDQEALASQKVRLCPC